MVLASSLKHLLLLAGTVGPWLVTASESSHVIDLTESNFESITADEPLMLVEFFAPWCGHCKALAPHYDEAAAALEGKGIRLAKTDCVDQVDLCQQHNISTYPTIKVYRNGSPTKYDGSRKADGIVSYMIKQSLPTVSTVTAENHEEFLKTDRVVVVAYVASTEDVLYSVFSGVAETLHEEYVFGMTTDKAAALAAGVTRPAVVLYKAFDEGRVDLPSAEVVSATAKRLTAFIKRSTIALFDEISSENFMVYDTSGLPLAYLFVDPEDPRNNEYIEELMPIAIEHRSVVNFVWIDAVTLVEHAKNLVLAELKWPSFVIQDLKADLKYPLDQSTEPTYEIVRHMVNQFIAGHLQPKFKTERVPESQDESSSYKVVGITFEDIVYDDEKDVFLHIHASPCEACESLAPTWDTLAARYADLKDKVVIAKMDATENDLPPHLQVTDFPTLKFKPAGSRDFIDYEGDRSLESLTQFMESKAKNDLSGAANIVLEDVREVSAARPAGTPVDAHDEL